MPSHAVSSRWSSAHSSSSRTGQPGPEAGIAPSSRTRPARPGACASTMRAAVSSHSPYPDCSAAASPPRSRSVRRCSNSWAPPPIRSALRSARRRAASGSAGPPPGASSLARTRARRPVSHSSAQPGGSPHGHRRSAGREEQQQAQRVLARELAAGATALVRRARGVDHRPVGLAPTAPAQPPDRARTIPSGVRPRTGRTQLVPRLARGVVRSQGQDLLHRPARRRSSGAQGFSPVSQQHGNDVRPHH